MGLFNKIIDELKDSLDKNNSYKKEVIKIIKSELNIDLIEDEISFLKDGILKIKSTPNKKMIINLKKEKLINIFQQNNLKVFEIN